MSDLIWPAHERMLILNNPNQAKINIPPSSLSPNFELTIISQLIKKSPPPPLFGVKTQKNHCSNWSGRRIRFKGSSTMFNVNIKFHSIGVSFFFVAEKRKDKAIKGCWSMLWSHLLLSWLSRVLIETTESVAFIKSWMNRCSYDDLNLYRTEVRAPFLALRFMNFSSSSLTFLVNWDLIIIKVDLTNRYFQLKWHRRICYDLKFWRWVKEERNIGREDMINGMFGIQLKFAPFSS